ncbi:MAG: hypothetical protein VX223_09105, partial [Myxococcota bacterium]|nr:hypothetical protein [Myxococcota bacterium]
TGGSCTGSPMSCPTPSDPCLVSVCDPASGGCQAIPAPASTACDDGSLCTENDVCDGFGDCAGVPVVCPANVDNCEVGICNTFTGACITQAAENNTPCSDGDPCTVADFCLSGQCINGPLPKCTSNDPCVAAVCTADGTCSNIAFEDGDPCDDGDLCTVGEACSAGACVGSQPITCPVGGTECAVSQCNPATGDCEPTPIDEGEFCNDGDPCTDEDVCTNGSCAGMPVSCPDSGDPCIPLMCQVSTGFCAPTPLQNGDICNDGNLCTEATTCKFGVCSGDTVICTTTNDCQVASCEPTEGCTYTDAADGQVCATASCSYDTTCSQGTCSGGIPVQCPPASQPCAISACLDDVGCTTIPLANATLCDDGDACTSDEFCTDGVCAGGEDISCPAAGPCEVAICDPSSGCTVEPATDGTVCDDGDPCTAIDTCADGLCQSGTLVQCKGSDCQPSVCDPNTGVCISTLAPNGTVCDDGDKCLTDTTCVNGGCTEGVPVVCPDTGSDCTTSLCISATGQCEVFGVPDGTACDDQSACTTPDTCYAGVCVGQSAVTCPAASGCFVQVCDPITGACSPTLAEDDTQCEDGDACTTGDICVSGTCSTGSDNCCISAIDCDDSNICTNDTCASGYCVHSPSSLTVCAADIFVSAGNSILTYTANGQLDDTALLSTSFQLMTVAHPLGVMLLSGISDPVVYEPRTQTVSPLTPPPQGTVTSAAYDANQELWILATTEGLVYAYDAITDTLIATAAAPPGDIGQSAVDENTGRVYFPTSFGYLAVLDSADLSSISGTPLPITGTPNQVYIDAPRRRLLVTDPASDGTRVVDDTYGAGLLGDTLSGLGAPSQLALDPAGDRLYATYNEGGVVRGYSLSTLLPLTPPAVAISAPSRVSVDATNLFVLSSSGELHFMDATTFTALFPPLDVLGATDLVVYRPRRPPVIINEVSTGDSGWIELLVTATSQVDFSGVQLQGNGGSVDLSGLGALAPGSVILACHPNAPVIADCVVTSSILQPGFEDSWTLMNGSRVWDQYKTGPASSITGRVHPAIVGWRPEAISNTSGTPNAPNDDITLD